MVRLQVRFARAHMQPTKPTKKKGEEERQREQNNRKLDKWLWVMVIGTGPINTIGIPWNRARQK